MPEIGDQRSEIGRRNRSAPQGSLVSDLRSLELPAHVRAELVHNLDGQRGRRTVPAGSGMLACWGAEWARILELLAEPIGRACPEVRHRQTIWLLRAQHARDDRFGRALADCGPSTSSGRACWIGAWATVLRHLDGAIAAVCPEIRGRDVWPIVRARPNGVRIEFFENAERWRIRLADRQADRSAGSRIGAARLVVEFFEDEDAFARRLEATVEELREPAQVHAGRLTWM